MSTVIGDRDVLLLGSSQRALNPPNSGILLTTSAPAFKVDTSGNPLPSSITVKASLIGIAGFVNFTATGATVTDNGDNTATLAFSSLTGNSCTVTASITVNGQAFTSSVTLAKVTDGSSGTSGTSGNQYATAYLYQWAASTPALPNGTTGFTWASGINSTYSGTDNWSLSASNPSSPGLKLYVASVQITAAAGTASTTVSYSTATIQVWSANGTNGTNGVSGVQSTTVQVYRWDSSTTPAAPAGSPTYTWSTGLFGAAPTGWVLSPGTAPSQGMTLWAARVRVTDSATNSSTVFNWSDSAIIAVGGSGSNGAAGASGASYVTAYCASSTGTTSTAPAQTTGKTSLPATNDGGITGTWSAAVPALSTGQYLYQSDGIYDPSTNKVTWSIPYWSSLKVGNLSTIVENTGRLYVSDTISDTAGNWYVDSNGHMQARSFELQDASGNTILKAGGTLPRTYVPDAALNNIIDLSWWSRGAALAWTTNGETNSIVKCSPVSGADLLMPGPKGSDDAVWYCKETTGDSGPGGGWVGPYYSLDKTKTYRFVVPIRRIGGTGQAYWGVNGAADLNTTNLNNSNPYFVGSLTVPATDRWYLFVGYIYPANSSGNTNDSAGVWDCKTGAKVAAGTNFCFMPDGRQVNTLAYQFYANLNAEQLFGRPMINVVDGTEPSLREYFESAAVLNTAITIGTNGTLSGAGGGQVTIGGLGYSGDLNATNGAPAGTNVGSTPAQTVESNAAAGKSASDAIPGINSAIADKLSKTSASSLAATVTLTTGGSILSGTTTNGTYQSPSGFYGVQGGVVKFSVPISGDPTFGGQLTAAYGSFGSVTIASGGYVASGQTAYNTGTGFFLGYSGSTPVFSLGNANGTGIRWDGTTLTVQNPKVTTSFSVTLSGLNVSGYTNGATYTSNPISPTISSGTAPYTYSWAFTRQDGNIKMTSSPTDSTATIQASGTNIATDGYLYVTVTDANGNSKTASSAINISFGSGF